MRFHTSAAFAAARAAHAEAYSAWSAISAHPDPEIADRSLESKAADRAENEALHRVLSFPATTPMEIGAKLAFMREKEAETWTGYPEWMAQVERELIELQRPCVSPAVAAAFETWRDTWLAFTADCDDDGNSKRSGDAFLALMDAPCFTPGDFLAKVYVNQLGEHGYTLGDEPRGFIFELNQLNLTGSGGTHDDAAQIALARDIRECDLGRCMLALGRVNFDAADWIAAACRAQMKVYVVIQNDGSHGLYTGDPDGEVDESHGERFNICLALIAGGLGVIGAERRRSVIDYILEHQPKLVIDCRQPIEAAA